MPDTIFTSQVPAVANANDGQPIATATTFTVATPRTCIRHRFRAPTTVTGPFTGELWRLTSDDPATGVLIATATYGAAPITPNDWNGHAWDSGPVVIVPGVAYRTVTHNAAGDYVATNGTFFAAGITNGDLTAIMDGADPVGLGVLRNGVFRYGALIASPPSNPAAGANFFSDIELQSGEVESEGVGALGITGAGAGAKQTPSEGVGALGLTGTAESSRTVPLTALNFINVVTGIGQCVADGLAADSVAGLPCRVCLAVAGSIVADDCGCTCGELDQRNGQLAVTVTQIYPSATFPTAAVDDARQSRCGVAWLVAEVHIQVHRCVHTLDDEGNAPTCDQLLADAVIWHSDAAAVRKAAGCCVQAMKAAGTIREFALGATVPLGEEGGCTGSDLRVLVALPNCICP